MVILTFQLSEKRKDYLINSVNGIFTWKEKEIIDLYLTTNIDRI